MNPPAATRSLRPCASDRSGDTCVVPSGPLAGELNGLATLVLVEQDGAWRIAVFHNTLVAHPPAR